jgi:GntR family transcriptional repressor for pyruvate dehydrogenase complex
MAEPVPPASSGRRTSTTATLKAVGRFSPTQQVRDQLFEAIQRGDFPPGSLLPSERVLCESFGVSRVSVREAIAGLEAIGLVSVQHGKGAFVRETPSELYAVPFGQYLETYKTELLELMKVRGALDALSAEEAARRASPADRAEIEAALERYRAAAEGTDTDFDQVAALDVAFHLAIARASGSSLLYELLVELHGVLEESRRILLAQPGQLLRSVHQHEEIAAAVLSGDAALARRTIDEHVRGVRDWIEEFQAVTGD